VEIILTAWRNDTFAYKGKYWSYPAETQLPHDHPALYTMVKASNRTERFTSGDRPRPLQQPIPLYGGFTNSLRTVMYWARVGGKADHYVGQYGIL